MAYVLVKHKIGLWSEFERTFESGKERRRMLGSKGGIVLRKVSDPDNVFVVLEWADVQGAQRWAEGVDTHEGMKWSTSGSISELAVVEKVLETDA